MPAEACDSVGGTSAGKASDGRAGDGRAGDAASSGVEDLSARGDRHVWGRRVTALIAGVLALRLLYAWFVPLDLVHDEAYYWDWSRQLDYGYFSKPPMIAWLIALSTSLGGASTLVVRLPAIMLATGGLAFVYLLGSRMYGPRVGFWATLLSVACPGGAAIGLLMTIDAPLLCCWCAALYCFWRYLESVPAGPEPVSETAQATGAGGWGWLVLATLAAGLGVLSKQTMLGFLPLAGCFLLTGAADRRQLLRPGYWLFFCGTLLFLLPVVIWNAQHDWITAQHTGGHFHSDPVSIGKRLSRSAEYLGSQFGVVSPLTAALLVTLAVAAFRSLGRWGRRERYLICFSLFPLVGVLGLSLLQRVQPNWPAAFYPAGIILLCGWALGQTKGIADRWVQPLHLRRALVVGGVCMLATYAVPWLPGVSGSRLDPVVRLRGWSQLGSEVGRRFERLPRPDRALLVVTTGRAAGSELAFYMPQHPRVYVWNPSKHIGSQYDIWGGPTDKQAWDAMIVTAVDAEPPPALTAAFRSVRPMETITVPIGNGRAHRFQLWQAETLIRWPTPGDEILDIASPADASPTRR